MSSDEAYVCTLDEKTLLRAKNELNEEPKERLSAVQKLREWIESQPHIHTKTDTATLLIFLRGAKFSQLRAREMIAGNLIIKRKAPEWFSNIDTKDPRLLGVIDRGYTVPLPKRDKEGCTIIVYKIGALDASTKFMSVADEIRAGIVAGSYISQSEMTQVNGCVFIFDFAGMTSKHMTRWKLEDVKRWSKVWQKNIPGRFKAFHYCNAGTFFELIMGMIKPFLSKKFQERIHVHSTVESLYKHVDMELLPEDYLPDDYQGPHQGSIRELIDSYKAIVTGDSFRNMLLENSGDKFYIDEAKRPSNTIPSQSFRQLSVD